jgi:hypothetical protein
MSKLREYNQSKLFQSNSSDGVSMNIIFTYSQIRIIETIIVKIKLCFLKEIKHITSAKYLPAKLADEFMEVRC